MPTTRDVPFYLDEGAGEPVLLLHSGGMAHQEWLTHKDALVDEFRLLIPDLPGHGSTPLTGDELTMSALVEAAQAVLEDAGVDQAHVVGSSMGGATALRFAITQPEHVDRLVLFRIGYRPETSNVIEDLNLDDPTYWERMGMAEWLSRIHEPQGGDEAWKRVIQQAASLPTREPALHGCTREDLAHVESPTLIIAGDRDPIVPVDEAVEMYETIPESDLWIIPHATHVVASRTWRKQAFQEEIRRFLQSAWRSPTSD